ncbi:MAG: endonuclease/exonuclease/phosphatase family protein [Verrucomicrobiales bacterium]
MKVIAWNLAHQVRKRPIPDCMVDVIRDLEADTVLFNEYVDDEIREPFKEAMRGAGFEHQAVSWTPDRHNQIFAASRFAFETGDLQPPQFDGSAISNFLHLQFADFPVEMVGLRAPAYTKAADKHAYWDELAGIMESARDRPILFAGDVNYDPFEKAKRPEADTVPFHLCDGYVIPNPKGEWSYLAHSGNGFKIDHVIHTPPVKIENVEYLDWIRERFLAGEKIKKPVSDHAVLRFEVN